MPVIGSCFSVLQLRSCWPCRFPPRVKTKAAPPQLAIQLEVRHGSRCDRAIDLATGYLVRACGPDGKFAYQVDLRTGKQNSSYDIIRHAGAMYALAMANHAQPDPKVAAPLLRAAKFMRRTTWVRGRVPECSRFGPTAGRKSEAYGSKPRERYAELGGIGLGLVALAAARQVDPQSVPLEELQAWAAWFYSCRGTMAAFFINMKRRISLGEFPGTVSIIPAKPHWA